MTFNADPKQHFSSVVSSNMTNEISPQDLTKLNTGAEKNLIPVESERPCFVVLDSNYDAPDCTSYRPGVWFFGIKTGKDEAPPTLTQHWLCTPLHIDALTYDETDNNYGRLLRFTNARGNWKQWAMPMEMLKGDVTDVRGMLLSMGMQLDPSITGKQHLASYLQSQIPKKQMQAVLQTGWAGSDSKAFALPDCVIGPKASKVTYQAQALQTDEYSQRGTLDGWRTEVAALAKDNPILMLSLCTAFAGPLLALVGAESGGLHLIGDSSTGKTTALQAACSVWGGESFRRSWRATANGLEGAAGLFNDGLLALDEISECDPRDVGEVVYMLGNGHGKQRANRTGTARAITRWRCSVLSTGERSIEASMMAAGQHVKAGQAVRLLDIPVHRIHGAWDTLHDAPNAPAFSDSIKRACRQQYGTAGRAFLEKLTRDSSNFSEQLERIKLQLMSVLPCSDGQPARAAARLAVLALAGELATTYGITGWQVGDATQAAVAGLRAWMNQRGNLTGNLEHNQIAQAVLGFIERHGDSRFSNAATPYNEQEQRVHNRAGWWRSYDGGMQYLFTSEGMRKALNGFDFNHSLKTLQNTGLLAPGANGKSSSALLIHSRKVRAYVVTPNKLVEIP